MTYRVIQWATGPQGRDSIRQVIDHPHFELVGVYVYSPEKYGVDAGTLVNRPALGVTCSGDRDDVLSIDADVVLHMPSFASPHEELDADVVEILRSGKNVVSLAGYMYPAAWGEAHAEQFNVAGSVGTSTLFGTASTQASSQNASLRLCRECARRLTSFGSLKRSICHSIPSRRWYLRVQGLAIPNKT